LHVVYLYAMLLQELNQCETIVAGVLNQDARLSGRTVLLNLLFQQIEASAGIWDRQRWACAKPPVSF